VHVDAAMNGRSSTYYVSGDFSEVCTQRDARQSAKIQAAPTGARLWAFPPHAMWLRGSLKIIGANTHAVLITR